LVKLVLKIVNSIVNLKVMLQRSWLSMLLQLLRFTMAMTVSCNVNSGSGGAADKAELPSCLPMLLQLLLMTRRQEQQLLWVALLATILLLLLLLAPASARMFRGSLSRRSG
jgi:hypothetical protein